MAFLPFALVFGLVSKQIGVHAAGWMITAVTVLAGARVGKGGGRAAFRPRGEVDAVHDPPCTLHARMAGRDDTDVDEATRLRALHGRSIVRWQASIVWRLSVAA